MADGLEDRKCEVWVPRPISDVPPCEKVLVLEFANAVKVTDLETLDRLGVDRQLLLKHITEAFAEQIFHIGVFSGDPHPGNILVDVSEGHGKAKPVLLDFGLAKRLPKTMRLAFCKLILAAGTKDYFLLLESFDEMGLILNRLDGENDLSAMRYMFRDTAPPKAARSQAKRFNQAYMKQVQARKELKIRNPVDAYPGDLLFFIRALDLLRGLCSLLSVVQSPMRIFGDAAKEAFANSLRENTSIVTQFSPTCMDEESRFGSSKRDKYVMEAAIVQKLRELANEGEVLGCQVCVMHRDKVVANVSFGPQGVDDPRDVQPYTLFNCFSVTKAVTAAAVHVLVDEGKLNYDSPVALYWPEFGEKNPETTVAELLSHRAGLQHALPLGITFESFCDFKAMVRGMCKLDADKKRDDRKEASYHFLTFGWLVGGLVEAVTGMSFSDFVTRRITRPLGVEGEICIGIPEEWCHHDNPHHARLSTLDISRFMGSIDGSGPDLDSFAVDEDEMNEVIKRIQTRAEAMKGKQENEATVPSKAKGEKEMMALIQDLKGKEFLFDLRAYNSKKMRKACIPAANGHFSARALACFYHSFVSLDEGQRLFSTDTYRKVVEPVAFEVFESMDGSGASKTMQWGLGYQLYPFKMASGDTKFAFGHSGVGGSLG